MTTGCSSLKKRMALYGVTAINFDRVDDPAESIIEELRAAMPSSTRKKTTVARSS